MECQLGSGRCSKSCLPCSGTIYIDRQIDTGYKSVVVIKEPVPGIPVLIHGGPRTTDSRLCNELKLPNTPLLLTGFPNYYDS